MTQAEQLQIDLADRRKYPFIFFTGFIGVFNTSVRYKGSVYIYIYPAEEIIMHKPIVAVFTFTRNTSEFI